MAFCTLCSKDLSYKTGGIHALRCQHLQAIIFRVERRDAGWKGTVKASFAPKQETAVSVVATDAALRMEFLFAEHKIPLAVADHLSPLLPIPFPDSKMSAAIQQLLIVCTLVWLPR